MTFKDREVSESLLGHCMFIKQLNTLQGIARAHKVGIKATGLMLPLLACQAGAIVGGVCKMGSAPGRWLPCGILLGKPGGI